MPEVQNYSFSFQDIVELLIKKENIHEGIWGIYIEFGLGGANIEREPGSKIMHPAALVPIVKIGIQRFQEENNLSVDASKVNPKPSKKTVKKE